MSPSRSSETLDPPVENPIRKWVLNFLKFGVTLGILVFLYRRGMLDLNRVKSVLTNGPVVICVFLALASTTLASVVRWYWLLKGQDISISRFEALKLTMIGVFFNTAIPGAVSGDVIKGYYIVKAQPNGRGRIKAFTTLLIDRILGLSALICVSFVAMLLHFEEITASKSLNPLAGLITILWLGVVGFFAFVLIRTPWTNKIQKFLLKLPMGELWGKFFDSLKAYESKKGIILKGLGISVFIHCMVVTATIVLSNALGGFQTVPADKFFFLVPFGLLVTAIPIAPAGLGTGHAAFLGLFNLVGATNGADLFTAFVSFQIFLSLIGGVFYLKYKNKVR